MELKPITDLIDKRTRIVKTMIHTSARSKKLSGYIACVIGGVLVQRRLYDMAYCKEYDACSFVVYRRVNYALNTSCKPMSGAFNKESLYL